MNALLRLFFLEKQKYTLFVLSASRITLNKYYQLSLALAKAIRETWQSGGSA
jgi:hypothetical protein